MAPDAIVPAWAHMSMQNRSRSSASPRVPRSQPARSVCRVYICCESADATQCATRGISVESCQQLGKLERCWHAREVLVRFGGSARRAHACDMRSEIVFVVCGSTSSTLWHAYRPFAEHTGGGRRSVQSKRAWVSSMSDFIVRLFGATQVGTVRTQHNTTYRRKNGTLIRERTLTGGPAACRRLADRAPWISSRISRSVEVSVTVFS